MNNFNYLYQQTFITFVAWSSKLKWWCNFWLERNWCRFCQILIALGTSDGSIVKKAETNERALQESKRLRCNHHKGGTPLDWVPRWSESLRPAVHGGETATDDKEAMVRSLSTILADKFSTVHCAIYLSSTADWGWWHIFSAFPTFRFPTFEKKTKT